MKHFPVLIMLLAMSLLVAGCANKGGSSVEESPGPEVDDLTAADASASALSEGSDFGGAAGQGGPRAEPGSPLAQRVIYFEYDQSTVKSEFLPVVEAHAGYLRDNPGVKLSLEGHADERGTREYNIALGDRRANGVNSMMLYQGVAPGQVEVISFGEERPAVIGHDDGAWGQNRRVVLVYAGES